MALLIEGFAAERGDRPALIDEAGTTTWAQLDERVTRLVHALRARGLTVGDTLAVMSPNRRELFEVHLAATHGGWVVVPVNWHWSAAELAYVLGDSGSKALVVDPRYAAVAAAAKADPQTSGVSTWLVYDPVGLAAIGGAGAEGLDRYEAAIAAAESGPIEDPSMGGPMFYTSGTTGFPKGVRSTLSTTGVDPSVMQLITASFTTMLGLDPDGVAYLNGPAYHSAQWVFSTFPLIQGSTVVMRHAFDPAEALRLIDAHGVTSTHLVPTQMVRLLRLPDDVRGSFDGSSLKVVYHGAAPCPPEVKAQMLDWWGPVVTEYYGGTEAGFLTILDAESWRAKPTSVGRPIDSVEVMIADDDGNEVSVGTRGQIWSRSRLGADFHYHRDEEKTRSAHRDGGWGTLGDIGYLDDDGDLHLSDRKIDMIISGGVNIYPAEIEGALISHPRVADAAVFGVPDEEMGESVMAVVQLFDGSDGDDDLVAVLQDHVRERIAGYKVPRRIEFSADLPRTPTGKLLKRLLRDPHWEDTGRSI